MRISELPPQLSDSQVNETLSRARVVSVDTSKLRQALIEGLMRRVYVWTYRRARANVCHSDDIMAAAFEGLVMGVDKLLAMSDHGNPLGLIRYYVRWRINEFLNELPVVKTSLRGKHHAMTCTLECSLVPGELILDRESDARIKELVEDIGLSDDQVGLVGSLMAGQTQDQIAKREGTYKMKISRRLAVVQEQTERSMQRAKR